MGGQSRKLKRVKLYCYECDVYNASFVCKRIYWCEIMCTGVRIFVNRVSNTHDALVGAEDNIIVYLQYVKYQN